MVLLPSMVIGIQCTKEEKNMGEENNEVLRKKQFQEVVSARIDQLCKKEGFLFILKCKQMVAINVRIVYNSFI